MSKKTVYIGLFTLLGVLLSTIVHGVLEMWYIQGLIADFPKYSLAYTWAEWFTIHRYFSVVTLMLGLIFGYFQGRMWWRWVYVEKRFDSFFRKLQKVLYG